MSAFAYVERYIPIARWLPRYERADLRPDVIAGLFIYALFILGLLELGLGRIPEAIEWSERAITQCLGRDGQLRARSLNIEMLGLRSLGAIDRSAVGLYATGAHRPAR